MGLGGYSFCSTRLVFFVPRFAHAGQQLKRAVRGAYGKTPTKPKTLGQRVRLVRVTWKWSQTQLANALGTNQQTVSHWEQERQQPTDATLHSLASLLGMEYQALISGKGFFVPSPPQPIGDLLLPASLAKDLVKLPPMSEENILLVIRGEQSAKPLSPEKATALIHKAHKNKRSVWIVM
jgi:DNA-binding transcriptional regulator YiaG